MDRENFGLITFYNSHTVLKSEKIVEHLDIKIVPIPAEISAGCGLCIMCDITIIDTILDLLNKNSMKYEKIYLVEKNGFVKKIKERF